MTDHRWVGFRHSNDLGKLGQWFASMIMSNSFNFLIKNRLVVLYVLFYIRKIGQWCIRERERERAFLVNEILENVFHKKDHDNNLCNWFVCSAL